MSAFEAYFQPFRDGIVGNDTDFDSPFGRRRIVYADWVASGRLYRPIEDRIVEHFGPFVGNTHSESSVTGMTMTRAYHLARDVIRQHVNAAPTDVLITAGSGMTRVVNKFQRILGLRAPDLLRPRLRMTDDERPVVFVTHMEHHSNHTSWLETLADVKVIGADREGFVDLDDLRRLLAENTDRKLKIGAFTACSNVTGIATPIHELAAVMHEHGGVCFVDFAASAPYVEIDMHPADPARRLDAVMFSPHKFLGGPGSAGVLVFDSGLHRSSVPDAPGGGTVDWTNPWGERRYVSDVEAREDGGTPAFLQTIRAALAIRLKEEMTVERMLEREHELLTAAFEALRTVPGLVILADRCEDRLGVISYYIENVHYNLIVRLLNDRYGIQVRGGCSCAGTYGHYLLHVDWETSHDITERIDHGDLSAKPGWVRLSLHPTMTNAELDYILDAVRETAVNADEWGRSYRYDPRKNEYSHESNDGVVDPTLETWFDLATEEREAAGL